jgi:UV DNA damage endonuclease
MNYSLCCISNQQARKGVKFQKMTYTRFKALPRAEAIKILSERILNNFVVTHKTIQHCISMGLEGYRLSSDITPVINHPDVNLSLEDLNNFSVIDSVIKQTAELIKTSGIRITAHPSEFISLTSLNPEVIANSIRDLISHADIFDRYNLKQDYWNCLNIHCRQEGDAQEISTRFINNYNKLPDTVKKRLAVEVNDNKNGVWTIKNLCNYFYNVAGIPVTFDTLHHTFCNHGESDEEAFNMAYKTWPVAPVFHYSEGIGSTRNHAEFASSKPKDYNKPVLWDIELKGKDDAIELMLAV